MSDLKCLRESLHLKQKDFWENIGVSAPSGSQYEHGGRMPKPVQLLIDLVYRPGAIKRLARLRGTTDRKLRGE